MATLTLTMLPSVIIQKILSYLSWKEKLLAVSAMPGWEDEVCSAAAWQWFESSWDPVMVSLRGQMKEALEEEACCVQQYGRYFQNCTLTFLYYDLHQCGLEMIKVVALHCPNLKSLTLCHPNCFTFSHESELLSYIQSLKLLCSSCQSLRQIRLCNLDYLALNRQKGIEEIFQLLNSSTLVGCVTMLEFSHAYDIARPVTCLLNFQNLRHLKAPVHNLTSSIILLLIQRSLKQLHLVSDGSTMNENFVEQNQISWCEITSCLERNKSDLAVHYIFQERTLRPQDLTPNSLTRSVVLDSLCNSVSRDLLRSIAALYGNSLETFAHLTTKWMNSLPYEDVESLPCDYYYFASQCVHLRTFACTVAIPCEAIWCLAMKGQQLQQLYVNREQLLFNYRVCMPFPAVCHENELDVGFLQKEVSQWLNCSWSVMSEDDILLKTRHLVHF